MATKYNSKKNKKPRLTKGRSLSMSPKNVGLHRRQCRNKHPLKKNTNMRIETCADCRAKVAKNGIMHSCKSCRFHVCKVCYSKPSCNNGHALTTTRTSKNGIICGNTQCNYRARRGLTMKHCRLCKYYLCLGCFGCETCPGNHGLRLSRPSKVKQSLNDNNNNNNTEMKTASNNNSHNNKKNSNNNNNEAITCGKCRRIFDKPNIPLFLCHECRYYLCGDCYQPSILFHRKRKEKLQKQHKKQQANNNNNNKINIIAPQAKVDANGNSIPNINNTSINGSSSAASAPSVVSSTTNIIIDDHDEKMQTTTMNNNNMLADNYYWGTDDETLTSGGGSGNKNLKATGGHSGSKSDTCLDELNDISQEPKELTRIPSIATECIICMETDKKMAFQPCGHYVACENCAMLMKLEGNCPICSAKILGLFRIFE